MRPGIYIIKIVSRVAIDPMNELRTGYASLGCELWRKCAGKIKFLGLAPTVKFSKNCKLAEIGIWIVAPVQGNEARLYLRTTLFVPADLKNSYRHISVQAKLI